VEEMSERGENSDKPRREFGRRDLRLSGLIDRLNLQRAVEQLPRGYKAMFMLHDVEGYEHHEIAQLLGCSVGNSKSQLHKARLRLRDLLQETLREGEREKRKSQNASSAREPRRRAFQLVNA
jgi:RNA polymerase sigma-70 factor, ECF subfamily